MFFPRILTSLYALCTINHVVKPAVLPQSATFEKLDSIPTGWTQGDRPSSTLPILFRIAVRQEDRRSTFEKRLIEISTPGSSCYGEHMGIEELNSMLKPHGSVSDDILSWLAAQGVLEKHVQDDGHWINVLLSVSQAEETFNTRFSIFTTRGKTYERFELSSIPYRRTFISTSTLSSQMFDLISRDLILLVLDIAPLLIRK